MFNMLRRRLSGGILTGYMIEKEVAKGRIQISGFDKRLLNPNSYNLSIGDKVTVYDDIKTIDLKDPETYSKTNSFLMDDVDGMTLRPGVLYLVQTKEEIGSDYYEPIITGRSSIGRLGLSVHQEAGFADIGYHGHLTLQLKVTYPTIIYPGLVMCQVYFLAPYGKVKQLYRGKYKDSNTPYTKWNAKE